MDLSRFEVFINELICGFLFIGEKGVHLADLGDKGVIHVDFMIIRLGGGKSSS